MLCPKLAGIRSRKLPDHKTANTKMELVEAHVGGIILSYVPLDLPYHPGWIDTGGAPWDKDDESTAIT